MSTNVPTKEKQLLIYMHYAEGTDFTFTLHGHADILISRGMTSSKNALSAMLNTLKNKGFVTNTINRGEWVLTEAGHEEAEYWIQRCYYSSKQPIESTKPKTTEQPTGFEQQPTEDEDLPGDDCSYDDYERDRIERMNAKVAYYLGYAAKFLAATSKILQDIEVKIY